MPGLPAKPVIDLMAPVASLEAARPAIGAAAAAGYCHFPYKAETMHWFCKPSPSHRTHHLHLVPFQSPAWVQRLAFRDALRRLFPLVRRELGGAFQLDRALAYGTLPEVWNLATDPERADYLRAYAHGYLREEIRAEQVVRRLDPFRRFLPWAEGILEL